MTAARRVVVGITGATGAIYAVRLLKRLREAARETHLVASPAGVLNVHHELGLDRRSLEALADVAYAPGDVGAAIASGSFATEAMIVTPCSMKSLAAIAHDLHRAVRRWKSSHSFGAACHFADDRRPTR